ncbi:hypothetical protein ACH4UM_04595 [Streptomyces sp. NPDC020801]|uniref:hypothetical protein n=1 Tax=unclassified Streptomyces TaxID=2593676 RepID=UPI0037A417BE
MTAAVTVALLAALTTGCARHNGTASTAAPSTAPSTTAPSATAPAGAPSGYADMEKKVNAAESAAAAADSDATSNADR